MSVGGELICTKNLSSRLDLILVYCRGVGCVECGDIYISAPTKYKIIITAIQYPTRSLTSSFLQTAEDGSDISDRYFINNLS